MPFNSIFLQLLTYSYSFPDVTISFFGKLVSWLKSPQIFLRSRNSIIIDVLRANTSEILTLVGCVIFILIIFVFILNRTAEALWIDGDVIICWLDVVLAFFVVDLFHLSRSDRSWCFMSISFLVWSYGNFLYKRLRRSLDMANITVLTLPKVCGLR